jgi:serine/threonine protein kinase
MGISLALGTVLADTYRVVRLVGAGGMGEVYEATHDRLSGRYAVKDGSIYTSTGPLP